MPTTKEQKLPYHRAVELFKYDPETGIITNRVSRGSARAGAVAGTVADTGYRRVGICGTLYRAHRIAWLLAHGEWPANQIDHIDGDRLNNRIDNLRAATGSENQRNRALNGNNKSGIIGVSWHTASGKWRAQITIGGKRKVLGHFSDKADAIQARKAAEVQHGFHPNHGRHGQ